jgi:hypothetical protein
VPVIVADLAPGFQFCFSVPFAFFSGFPVLEVIEWEHLGAF